MTDITVLQSLPELEPLNSETGLAIAPCTFSCSVSCGYTCGTASCTHTTLR